VCLLTVLAVLTAAPPSQGVAAPPAVSIRLLAAWRVPAPVGIEDAGDGSGRLFIVEQAGRIRVVRNGVLSARPFLDIRSRVTAGGERGLLGLAFPPGFAAKRYFYVDYTDLNGDTVIARYRVSATDPDVADPASEQVLLRIDQPYANHNGGQISFGPDGYLYIAMGDGGSGGDPLGNGQKTNTLLGKILRIDTESGATPYGVPASNPFVGNAAYRPEIWALGLRNPWRFSWDRATGALWIADVGQNAIEEIDYEPAGFAGGRNYGWNRYEGTRPYPPGSAPKPTTGLTFPVFEYDHTTGGHSVTGGFVYRGVAYPGLVGAYFCADFEWGKFWAVSPADFSARTVLDTALMPSTFGEDEAGELYVADYVSGTVFRVTDGALPPVASVRRLQGADRYATAIAVARDAFPSGCTTAVVATGEGFADALAASGLAGAVGAPVLLTPSDRLPAGLVAALGPGGLGVRDVVIVGGPVAVSSGVARSLAGAGFSVSRVQGRDRYATAGEVARRVAAAQGASFSGRVFVVRGDTFADALAVSPLSAAGRGPILLTAPDRLPDATRMARRSIGATEAVVVGGVAAVSNRVVTGLGVPVERVSGADRYATAAALAERAFGWGWTDFSYVGVARGTDYPDGLAGGVAAGSRGGVLVLTEPTRLSPPAADALIRHQGDITGVAVYGGTRAVGAAAFEMVRWHVP
jgi:putative cell wall-binding protein/glucose/arabinose dehydrogenase